MILRRCQWPGGLKSHISWCWELCCPTTCCITEKLTSVHTGLYSYLQPISATILALLRRQVELDYNNLIAAGLILIGIVLVVITYEKYKFPVPKI